ncbi:MAG: endonuclease/exonuclease/phosphatase family metal-dependent hydrolase [Alphaproteobacteria bacterium]|jgi:endonuclease/exonuclease/phosphatase family metal-dependent hydrolase
MLCHNFAFAMSQNMTIRIASFNVSMEASNYVAQGQTIKGNELSQHLLAGNHPQIQNIAEIIQRVRPDIILLNEFDFSKQSSQDIKWFIKHYLNVSQSDVPSIDYPYFFAAPVNTGVNSKLDLDGDGVKSGIKGDAFGYGLYPGQYGMAVLSKFPIQKQQIRTFQHFLWKDMPNNLLSKVKDEDGEDYYSKEAQQILRLSSKSHWDMPIKIGEQSLHILASHPTPPVFDGYENRNGKRNHDEIRFWTDYISGSEQSAYIYDDKGEQGGFTGKHLIIAGDLNASPDEGDGLKSGISGLIAHSRINDKLSPKSEGGSLHSPNNSNGPEHTAGWRMRADYVLPSSGLNVTNSGVFWPIQNDPLFRLIKDRQSSSDHRLVWVDIKLTK